MRRTRLAGALTAVIALALTATGCCGDSPKAAPAAKAAAAPDRVEPLSSPASPELPVTVGSA
ncbi:ABC transporter substrate-binding protein, partial [Streptomyces sp. NPDC056049]